MGSNFNILGVLRKVPSLRNTNLITVEKWIEGKKMDDGAEGLWRIHDDLYDFTDFSKNHPGGQFWLDTTKGTDITEAFESHHVSGKPEMMLAKYRVRKAKTPRISLVTFKEDGFYKSLKRKIKESGVKIPAGSSFQTRFLADSFLVAFLTTSLMGVLGNYWWSVLAGLLLQMCTISSHNFFHMRDNFRMFYFNLSLNSFREWRISHALSHHQYTNTFLDLEIRMFEPIFWLFPSEDKTFISRFLPWIISPVVFLTLLHIQFFLRIKHVICNGKAFIWDEYLGLLPPIMLWLLTNAVWWKVFISWNITILTASFMFYFVGLIAAHHHPDIYHEGDYFGDDKDFGILQLAAVRDRQEVNGKIILTLTTFGDHVLHHMFPTVDHYHLNILRPYLKDTCKEFNVNLISENTGSLFMGLYKQLARNYVNGKLFIKNIQNQL